MLNISMLDMMWIACSLSAHIHVPFGLAMTKTLLDPLIATYLNKIILSPKTWSYPPA
jgi:hypothetical protein